MLPRSSQRGTQKRAVGEHGFVGVYMRASIDPAIIDAIRKLRDVLRKLGRSVTMRA